MTSRLPISDVEMPLLTEEVDNMITRVRRLNLSIKKAREVNENRTISIQLDDIISSAFTKLRARKVADFSEKVFELVSDIALQSGDNKLAANILAVRLHDTMEVIVAVKKKFRGVACPSLYEEKTAKAELKKRKLL